MDTLKFQFPPLLTEPEVEALLAGVALGLVLWFLVVWLTPFGGGGHWLAARMIGGGRWVAGETLTREADAGTWARMVQLYQACPRTSPRAVRGGNGGADCSVRAGAANRARTATRTQ